MSKTETRFGQLAVCVSGCQKGIHELCQMVRELSQNVRETFQCVKEISSMQLRLAKVIQAMQQEITRLREENEELADEIDCLQLSVYQDDGDEPFNPEWN